MIFITLLVGGFYVGWNIGANDAANCMGTPVGSGLLSYRRAANIVALFAIIGALLHGNAVIKTVGRGIVAEELPYIAVLVVLIAAGLFISLATLLHLPVSTSQAIVGAMSGVGFAVGTTVDLSQVSHIGLGWIVSPGLTAVIAFALYHLLAIPMHRIKGFIQWERVLRILVLVSVAYMAFAMGANNVGNAIGPIVNVGGDPDWLTLLGAAAVAVGILTGGRRVTQTVGSGITPLDPLGAFTAQLAAALAIHSFSLIGLPVSTSQAVIGAIAGVGLVKGMSAVNRRQLFQIVIGWMATPITAGLLAFGLYRLLSLFF
ncbi:inorganic phosphate transporter family protein [Candidatus Acetothermia bacterium]|jgi:PiT family inorganic phosphate transporter|nr:inorganic phosphate transporter family protein [Candidatus Acetothermia bacterium]MCI2426923.1 inorganic phosphate transporter family protein [Candidatus Acetothermia bacterium]MCI2428878.1 inorganic phosphate transporter family protein [Candidatus Acetothermia bacterium]